MTAGAVAIAATTKSKWMRRIASPENVPGRKLD
jgi:hypothetical protein